jgi:hypothetical protein
MLSASWPPIPGPLSFARGEGSRIEAASDSRLFGFDFLTLGAISIHSGNKLPRQRK